MGSVGGGDTGMLLDETLYFMAAKKYLPIKANSRVAYEKNRLQLYANAKNIKTQLIRPRLLYAISVQLLNILFF